MNNRRRYGALFIMAMVAVVASAAPKPTVLRVKNGEELSEAIRKTKQLRSDHRDLPIEIVLAKGDYSIPNALVLRENENGFESSDKARITIRGGDDGMPRLCGGSVVTGWKRVDFNGRSDVWVADVAALGLTKRLTLFYYDGAAMTCCRWPNVDHQKPYSGGWAYVDGVLPKSMYEDLPTDRLDQIQIKRSDFRQWSKPSEGELMIFPRYNWWNSIHAIASFDAATGILKLSQPVREGYAPRPMDRYCIMGMREELDVAGEWYHDAAAQKLYFIPPNGEDPNRKRTAVCRSREPIFWFFDTKNVVVRGLEFCEAERAVIFSNTTRCGMIGCKVHDIGYFDGGAIHLGGRQNVVRDSDIWNTGAHGIMINGIYKDPMVPERRDGNVVKNCYIHHCGRVNRHGFAVMIDGQGSKVVNNLMHDLPRGAIYYAGRFQEICRNRIRHVNLEMEDTGAIYGGGYIRHVGTKINENWISDSIGFTHDRQGVYTFRTTSAWGIYLDDSSGGAEVVGNFVIGCSGGMHMHCARFNLVSNNVFVSCSYADGTRQLHSIGGWEKTSDLNNMRMKYLHNKAQRQYEELIAYSSAWTNYPTLRSPPNNVEAPDGLILQGNRLVNNIWYYPDQPKAPAYALYRYNHRNNVFDNNVIWNGSHKFLMTLGGRPQTMNEWRKLGQDLHSIAANPDFIAPNFVDPAQGNWDFKPNSPARKLGIWPVHPESAGLYVSVSRPELPVEAEGAREHPEWIKND